MKQSETMATRAPGSMVEMQMKYIWTARLETDRGELRPENGQHGRRGGERQAQVCHDQHGEEIVRGCMEAVVSLYHPE